MTRPVILCLGAGRMGRGIAVCFAYAGHDIVVLDAKPRPAAEFARLAAAVREEVAASLGSLAACGLFDAAQIPIILGRLRVVPEPEIAAHLHQDAVLFEGVPETLAAKHDVLARISALADPRMVIASTTSTIMVDDLSPALVAPERFLNAHWLNPAYLIPLVEISPGQATDPAITARLVAVLEGIGKIPVICRPSPGFIVPRLQALVMNEAARLVAEGVASPAEIDRAIRYGFGFRFSVLGVLEFIDWGGGDILFHASRYLSQALGTDRFTAPDNVVANMQQGRLGLGSGEGFFTYPEADIPAYRHARLQALVERLRQEGLARPPVLPGENPE